MFGDKVKVNRYQSVTPHAEEVRRRRLEALLPGTHDGNRTLPNLVSAQRAIRKTG